jgi:hypothetical protein
MQFILSSDHNTDTHSVSCLLEELRLFWWQVRFLQLDPVKNQRSTRLDNVTYHITARKFFVEHTTLPIVSDPCGETSTERLPDDEKWNVQALRISLAGRRISLNRNLIAYFRRSSLVSCLVRSVETPGIVTGQAIG